jgi:hypothetical protein
VLDTKRMEEVNYEFLKEYMLRSEGKVSRYRFISFFAKKTKEG